VTDEEITAGRRQRRAERRARRVRVHHDDVCDPPNGKVPPVLLDALRATFETCRLDTPHTRPEQ
jgi:hypothetical protein